MNKRINLLINGEKELHTQSINLIELLKKKDIDDKVVAIALNLQVIKKELWLTTLCQNNDSVEIIEAVQGG